MARVDCTGAEKGLLELDSTQENGVGANFEAFTSDIVARSGQNVWLTDTPANTNASGRMILPATELTLTTRFSVMVTSMPAVTEKIIMRYNTGVAAEFIDVVIDKAAAGDSTFRAWVRMTDVNDSSDSAKISGIPIDNGVGDFPREWIDLHFIAVISAVGDDVISLRVNAPAFETGAPVLSKVSVTANRITTAVAQIDFGIITSTAGAIQVLHDDIICDDTDTEIGNPGLHFFEPTAESAPNTWGTNAATKVGALTDEDQLTRIQIANAVGDTNAEEEQYQLADIGALGTTSKITAVYYSTRDNNTHGTTAGVYRIRSIQGASTVESADLTVSLLVPQLQRSRLIRTQDAVPANWTLAKFNSSEMGIFWPSGQLATAGARVTEFWGYAEIAAAAQVADSATVGNASQPKILNRLALNDSVMEILTNVIKARFSQAKTGSITRALLIRVKIPLLRTLSFSRTIFLGIRFALSDSFTFDENDFATGEAAPITEIFNTSTTWVVPGSISPNITVECWGGGGGAEGAPANRASSAGGGGGYSKKALALISGDTSFTVTVGVGGNGGGSGGNSGGTGGDTWVKSTGTVLAKGGGGGVSTGGGQGGQASAGIGDTKFSGGNGQQGTSSQLAGGGGGAGSMQNGGNGGTSGGGVRAPGGIGGVEHGGDGGASGLGGFGNNGLAGSVNGGGGGGGDFGGSGGAGARGQVRITYTPAFSSVSTKVPLSRPLTESLTTLTWVRFARAETAAVISAFTLLARMSFARTLSFTRSTLMRVGFALSDNFTETRAFKILARLGLADSGALAHSEPVIEKFFKNRGGGMVDDRNRGF